MSARALRMSRPELERLADATGTPLPWREPAASVRRAAVPRLLVDALATFATAEVAVELTVSRRLAGATGVAQLTSWQRLRGDRVTAISAAGPAEVELAWFRADRWPGQLARAATVGPAGACELPPAAADVPLDRLLTGQGHPWLHRPRGRLLATVAGRRGIGWVSWLLFADGWRSLAPYVDGGVPTVRVRRVRPARLGAQVALLAAGARR